MPPFLFTLAIVSPLLPLLEHLLNKVNHSTRPLTLLCMGQAGLSQQRREKKIISTREEISFIRERIKYFNSA